MKRFFLWLLRLTDRAFSYREGARPHLPRLLRQFGCAFSYARDVHHPLQLRAPLGAMKRFLAPFLCLCLTGCTLGASVDSLLRPPSLSAEQQQIYSALQNAVGTDITLQYPRTGTNLSAFTVADLDGDGADEALVFYEKQSLAAAENDLRIGVLDQVDGSWQAVCDMPADGTEIETVEIAPLGDAGQNLMCLGYSGAEQSDKLLVVSTYSSGTVTQNFSTGYTYFQISDFDEDSEDELLVLTRSSDTVTAAAALYRRLSSGEIALSGRLELRAAFSDYSGIYESDWAGNTPAIFIDGQVSASTMQTEIITVSDGALAYVLSDSDAVAATVRSVGLGVMDLDQDGIREVPVQTTFPGYEEGASEQVRLTRWLELSGTALSEIARGYWAVSDGCIFILPKAWYDEVTAYTDPLTEDVVFCRYDAAAGSRGAELLRYRVITDAEEAAERSGDGYHLLRTRGGAYYYFYTPTGGDTPTGEDDLLLDWTAALAQFRFV